MVTGIIPRIGINHSSPRGEGGGGPWGPRGSPGGPWGGPRALGPWRLPAGSRLFGGCGGAELPRQLVKFGSPDLLSGVNIPKMYGAVLPSTQQKLGIRRKRDMAVSILFRYPALESTETTERFWK